MQADKPYAPACDRNKDVILSQLQSWFTSDEQVLEIGSGTGQHAVHMAQHMPSVSWQSTELEENLPGVKAWIDESGLTNLLEPQVLDVSSPKLQDGEFSAIFSANTLHIMAWDKVIDFFHLAGQYVKAGGKLCVYGPFNYHGQFTSDSNAAFDDWLKQRDPVSGIRDFEAINTLAEAQGFKLQEDVEMPANNRLLYWRR